MSETSTGEIVAAATANTGGNLRQALIPTTSSAVRDSESCATWASQTGNNTQLGAAFRVRVGPAGRVRAVTITQNIWFGARWIFNVHEWDSSQSPPMSSLGNVSISVPDRALPEIPLRFCARLVGETVSFKIWPTSELEPTWTEPGRSGSVQLPVSARGSGATGWYVGHLGPGDQAVFDDLAASTITAFSAPWYPFESATDFVIQQDLDLGGAKPTSHTAAAEAALITDPAAAVRFIDERADGPWAGGTVGPVYRLYQAFFRRPPDQQGLVHWSNQMHAGHRLSSIASSFVGSSEFRRTYGTLTNAEFVNRVYRNVLGRAADPAGSAYWLRRLSSGLSRGAVMTSFSESPENRRSTANDAFVETINFTMQGRALSAADMGWYVDRLAHGSSRSDLIAEILDEGEYSERVGAVPHPAVGDTARATPAETNLTATTAHRLMQQSPAVTAALVR